MNPKLFYIFIWGTLFLFSSCKRYYSVNMLGGDDVDVTQLVKKEHYKPIYNPSKKNEIIGLINPSPLSITNGDLQKVRIFLENKGVKMVIGNEDLRDAITYKSTYFITTYPVDRFDLNIEIEGKYYYVEIRKEVNKKYNLVRLLLPNDKDSGLRFKITEIVDST